MNRAAPAGLRHCRYEKRKGLVALLNICFNSNDAYCQHTAVAIRSILETNPSSQVLRFFILSDHISHENKEKLLSLTEDYPNASMQVIPCEERLEEIKNRFNLGAWKQTYNYCLYFYAGSLFPDLDKILWLDGDIIALKPLAPLWETDLTDKVVGAALDIPPFLNASPDDPFLTSRFYFNAGVLLFNLDQFRRQGIEQACEAILATGKKPRFCDQTVLNLAIPEQNVRHIDLRYNYPAGIPDATFRFLTRVGCPHKPSITREQWEAARQNQTIFHYIGGPLPEKPWFAEYPRRERQRYEGYLGHTPWRGTPPQSVKEKSPPVLRMLSKVWDTPIGCLCTVPLRAVRVHPKNKED